jgi:ATP-dependent helicase YprA (DUF1998 family)
VEPEALHRIPRVFCKSNSNLRCLFSTIAFGLGMQVPDVDIVIHWGPSDDILQYWQEVGRCGHVGVMAGKGKPFRIPLLIALTRLSWLRKCWNMYPFLSRHAFGNTF